jgi:hypothetical protein
MRGPLGDVVAGKDDPTRLVKRKRKGRAIGGKPWIVPFKRTMSVS